MKLHGYNRPRSNRSKRTPWYGRQGLSINPFLPGLKGHRLDSTEQKLVSYIKETSSDQKEHDSLSSIGKFPSSTISMILDGTVPFCLPVDIKTEIYKQPPSYTHIQSLKFGDPSNRPRNIFATSREDQEKCTCTGPKCGDDCFNRFIMTECIGSINCNLGDKDCGNRSLSKRQFVKVNL